VFLEPLAGCGGSAAASDTAGGGRCATLGWERGRMPSWPEKMEAGSARTGRLQKARETAAAILNFGRSIEI